jgi:hypothetical protein
LQGVVELFSPHHLFSVEFIMGMWFFSHVAASDTQPTTNMNQYEKQIVKLTLEAFKGFERTTDVLVYHVIRCMADAVTRLHFTSVDHRMAIEDAVLTALEKKGVEVCY